MRNTILVLFVLLCSSGAHAQSDVDHSAGGEVARELPEIPTIENAVDLELALNLARITWNESSSFASPTALYLYAQVVWNNGDTNKQRLAWLRRHSSCVSSDRALTEREQNWSNCPWTRQLTWSTTAPENWPANVSWEARLRVWIQLLQVTTRIVRGWRFPRPCGGRPITWGGPADFEGAIARGLQPLRCEGTGRNIGFARR